MNLIKFYKDSFSGLSKDVWFIALIYLVNRCGEMVIPFMSIYLTSELGFTKTQSGLVLTCFGLGALCGANIGGYLSDTIGNFKVMALSLFGSGIGFCSIVLFQEFYSLAFVMFLCAIFTGMFSPAAFSAVGFWGNPDNKTRGYSLLRMAINLGISIGPAMGGLLVGIVGYKSLFIADGITCFIALIVLFVVLGHRNFKYDRKKEKLVASKSPYKDYKLLLFLFFNLINMVAFFQILFSVPVYFKEVLGMKEVLIGTFFTANGLLVFFLEMPLVYKIEQKNNFFNPMVLGALLIGLAFACLSIFQDPLLAIIFYSLLVALGEVINFPLIPTLVMRRSDEASQGRYMGMVSMMFAFAFLSAPMLGLPIIDKIGFHTYFYLAAGLSLLSAICLWFLKPHFAEH